MSEAIDWDPMQELASRGEVHRGDTVRLQGTGATAEVTSVEPIAELPVFVGFPSAAFKPKAGDVLEVLSKPGDDLPALIA
ncbi:hypothetical protein [Corallococcus exercitus]|uniref:Uncharacterized protein n=1 Tax=Corallococcus exercitus TaxID=2316736 RepID=A0A7Y4NBL1_9BACT|nr:hypothetical protein [Corallococcus exercitus]NOK07466.1 hypothetical protein [Corallococcus exercitus]